MSLGGDNRTKHVINSSMGRSCNDTPPSESFTIFDASSFLRLYERPILGNHCLFHVLWYERWEDADIWLWASGDGNFVPRWPACVLIDMSLDQREAGVTAVIKRILPFMQSPKFPGFSKP